MNFGNNGGPAGNRTNRNNKRRNNSNNNNRNNSPTSNPSAHGSQAHVPAYPGANHGGDMPQWPWMTMQQQPMPMFGSMPNAYGIPYTTPQLHSPAQITWPAMQGSLNQSPNKRRWDDHNQSSLPQKKVRTEKQMNHNAPASNSAMKTNALGLHFCVNCEKDTHTISDCVGPPNWSYGDMVICTGTTCRTMGSEFGGHKFDDCPVFRDILSSNQIPQGVLLSPELLRIIDDRDIGWIFFALIERRMRKPCVRSRYVDWVDVLMEFSQRFHQGKSPPRLHGLPWPKEFSRALYTRTRQNNAGTGELPPWDTFNYWVPEVKNLPTGPFEAMGWGMLSQQWHDGTLDLQTFASEDRKLTRYHQRDTTDVGEGIKSEPYEDIQEEMRRLREENAVLQRMVNRGNQQPLQEQQSRHIKTEPLD